MINLLLFPVLIPFLFAAVLLLFPKKVKAQRVVTMIGLVFALASSFALLYKVKVNGVQALTLGSWAPPFGITMVSDMFSAMLVTSSLLIALFVVWYSFSSIGEEREKAFYYPAILFMLTGVNGAFTTGDIFNMFVFFEVLLMSSYVLIVLGGEKIQLKESIKYIIVNIVSSSLFVITVGYLYSVVGTLNMADISVKLAEIGPSGIVTVIAVLFLIVFGIKGGIFPLFFWLPGSYGAPPIPVLALFGALLTKVGVYAIMRTYTLFFTTDVGYTHNLLMILSILTIVVGCIGALAYFDVKQIIIYNIVIAVGVILFGASVMNESGMMGSVFYLIHDILIKGALFLLIGIIIKITGTSDLRKMGGLMKRYPLLAWVYLIVAFGLAGIPPLSGFIGKLLIVQGGFEGELLWQSIFILASSLLVLFSAIRIFIYAFWGEEKGEHLISERKYRHLLVPAITLASLTVLYGVGAEYLVPFMADATNVLLDPSIYVDAVFEGVK
ncbi:Na+/H+ antiporter subunit D [Psychrobacillus psychrodurans]|uniref:Na+/H+ antiporter subunit D n=1 Tax=Psychrobacillus psychrodurans TaxID=126157 RepID=A0A9X3LDH8_9BACI|nr:Na+/H+ antiporter subunit D [Psychrobacillus psychrodurans]MCZ8535204.1 Na+/H+ antiporter subunit D [Psychrobacillus psychrodurans]